MIVSSDPLGDNPNCRETYASFGLTGDDLVTTEVTRRTGIEPTFACDKGITRSQGQRMITQPTGVWYLSSKGALESTSAERHLIWLLDQIEPRREALQSLAAEQGAGLSFSCYWLSASGHGGPELTAGTIARLARINASLWFDVYGPEGDAVL